MRRQLCGVWIGNITILTYHLAMLTRAARYLSSLDKCFQAVLAVMMSEMEMENGYIPKDSVKTRQPGLKQPVHMQITSRSPQPLPPLPSSPSTRSTSPL
ncbi:Protein of unknown function [Pyronema omphalodes CBS 100304]|uniref:Uncharacterized protein n=1 Tax=Pyronema omphalodes (strain CBS 100304) TaxID=1076935 RepID=U4LLK0_PYROM|nr:Protein of unknown function [Pyronema omphalodes CBS 100304]